ncbi:MFS transporter [Streptomyces montanisoli]|uniref:MFS transporter n=1 Tax=Streptomyces montanisoli TaxID=2798581 RepID=A0A940MEB3_9ACTN|nr:MFS transporter [Streptomyces montanisoli]MBP0458771.1 MFS transporter [Streptomyces montanisoli]
MASIGNAMEWYDWSSYVAFAALLGPRFFPGKSAAVSVLGALAVFAVGFFFRPLGGALIGAYSDRRGRAAALRLSLLLMAGGSLLIAVAPTYGSAGVAAPALLVLARAVQGLSAGGEVTAMSTYVNEIAPRGRRGLYSSAIYISTTLGTLAATLLALALRSALPSGALADWGWRAPFALGALLAVYGWCLRRRMRETDAFSAAGPPQRNPALRVLRRHPAATARVVGFTLGTTVVYYTFASYLPLYAQHTHNIPVNAALWASLGAQLLFMAALPFFGALSDRYGRRPLLITFGAGFTLLSPLFFTLLTDSAVRLFAVMAAALLLFACCAASAPSAMLEMFPTGVRSSGIGLPYSLTVAVFGGTAPYLIEYLTAHGHAGWYPWYVVALCLVSTATFFLYRETKDVELRRVGEEP